MDEESYRIRGFQPRDYAQEAKIWNRIDLGRIITEEEIRRFEEKVFTPPLVNFKIVAEERSSGEAVGTGSLHHDLESFDPQAFWVDVAVDPAHRGRGLGQSLARAIQEEAGTRRARRLWAMIRADDARAVRFLDLQGYTELRRHWRSRLELTNAATLPSRAESLALRGVTFTTLAEENMESPELLRDLYDLTTASSADEPRPGPYTPVSFEQFVERDLRGPMFLPDAFFVARERGRFVALCQLQRAEGQPDTLVQVFTGTRREFRGRGIATELKRRTVEYGRAHGYRAIRTGNDSLNHPMLAINRKLGFQPEVVRILAEKQP